ncbi:MAG: amino acid ABC transporter substrate-binding protein [Christensenellaceae bacterium]|nr:amino acid ABC transporter substrate-binding protein [Christensenellaceae bacterium]
MALSLVACANNTSAPAAESPAAQQPSEAPAESPEAPAEPAEPAKSEAPADDSWDKVKAAGTFILGFDETFAPMGFKDEDGNYVGFDIDLALEVSSRLGIGAPTLMPINWDSKVMELNAGNIDLIWNGLTITEERKKEMLFSDPYMNNRQIIVVRAESDIQSKADLAGKRVAAQADSSAMEAIQAEPEVMDSFGDLVESPDYVEALLELKQGSVDAVVVDETMGSYYINKDENPAAFRILEDNFGEEQYGIGFRKADVALKDAIQGALNDMVEDGTFATISKKWFGHDVWPK